MVTYQTLQGTNEHGLQNLAGFIAVPDILESFGTVLATNIEEDLFSTTMKSMVSVKVAPL